MNTESKQAAEQLAGARPVEKSIAVLPDHPHHGYFSDKPRSFSGGAVKRPVGGSSPSQGVYRFSASLGRV